MVGCVGLHGETTIIFIYGPFEADLGTSAIALARVGIQVQIFESAVWPSNNSNVTFTLIRVPASLNLEKLVPVLALVRNLPIAQGARN